jgi:hypothetical protein
VRVTDDRYADTSLSKAIGQTAEYCDHVYFAVLSAACRELPVRLTRLLTATVNLDHRPLKLLVIGQQAGQKSNVVMRE